MPNVSAVYASSASSSFEREIMYTEDVVHATHEQGESDNEQ